MTEGKELIDISKRKRTLNCSVRTQPEKENLKVDR